MRAKKSQKSSYEAKLAKYGRYREEIIKAAESKITGGKTAKDSKRED